MFDRTGLEAAAAIIVRVLPPTLQYAWPLLGECTGCEVWVKHENHLPTGAFKIRGGLVLFHALKQTMTATGVIGAT